MAQLLLIKEASLSDRDNRQVGDVVGIYSDDHVFSAHEHDIFEIVSVRDSKGTLELLMPKVRIALKTNTTNWVLEGSEERKNVWQDSDGAWKAVVTQPRFSLRYELDALANNFARYEENRETTIVAAVGIGT